MGKLVGNYKEILQYFSNSFVNLKLFKSKKLKKKEYLFWLRLTVYGILFPKKGLNPGPQQEKPTVLTPGLPGNTLKKKEQFLTTKRNE